MMQDSVKLENRGYGALKDNVMLVPPGGEIPLMETPLNLPHDSADGTMQKTFYCCGRTLKKQLFYILFWLLLMVFLLSLAGAALLWFTNILINEFSTVLRNNSEAYALWSDSPFRPTMKVYIFNYTNWDEFKEGKVEKLHVEEVGPYVYEQHMEKVNHTVYQDRLLYQENYSFQQVPEKSNGSYDDLVLVPNIILLTSVSAAIDFPEDVQSPIDKILDNGDHKEAFVKLPVERFLWGYRDAAYDTHKHFLFFRDSRYDTFGLFMSKRDTTPDLFVVNTGEHHREKTNILETWSGHMPRPRWETRHKKCDSLYSTDGSLFPTSLLDRNQTLYVFNSNLARRMPFTYTDDVETPAGMKLLRYSQSSEVFDHDEYDCYCVHCPPNGLITMNDYIMGYHAFASLPHFANSDPKLLEDVAGLQPHKFVDNMNYIDIHPTTGITLREKLSLQLNMRVRRHSSFGAVRYFARDTTLPVAWIEMSVEDVPESLQLVIESKYARELVRLGATVGCILVFIVSVVCLAILVKSQK